MKEHNEKQLRELLKKAMQPVDPQLNRELWPQIRSRLDARPVQLPWFDWMLLGLVAIWCLFFPDAVPALLYHL